MQDREVAYEQNVSRLSNAWESRIDGYAADAVAFLTRPSLTRLSNDDDIQAQATEIVAARLLRSAQWATIAATDVSDIAYEAVCRELDSR